MSSRCPHYMVNFGPLAVEIGLPVWGTPANFNGFCILAALLHGSQVVGVSQTLRRWTEDATYVWQGDQNWPSCWAFAHILVGSDSTQCFSYAVQCSKEIRVSSKVCVLFSGTLFKAVNLADVSVFFSLQYVHCWKCCQLNLTDDHPQFITLSVHLCWQHVGMTHSVAQLRLVCVWLWRCLVRTTGRPIRRPYSVLSRRTMCTSRNMMSSTFNTSHWPRFSMHLLAVIPFLPRTARLAQPLR